MASEKDRVLGHADEADGIEEFDNQLPTWWLGLFFFTLVFAVVYGVDYHFVSHRSQEKELAAEQKERKAQAELLASTTGGASVAAAPTAEDGKAVFAANCVACHGADLHGGVGPDLTDATWIHGGTLDAIEKTITNGVPEKGMLTWGPILGPAKIAAVAKFVHESGGGQ